MNIPIARPDLDQGEAEAGVEVRVGSCVWPY